jgi:hypothetical protein
MPSSFIREEGRSMTPCALAQSAPTTRPCFPSVRGRSLCVAFSHVRDRNFYFQQFRADQNLFGLIPAGSGFLTVAKSHPVFSQYWENNYSNDREFCYEFFLSSRFSLSPLPLIKR